MTRSPSPDDRLKAIRGDVPGATGPLSALIVSQTWLWRWSGLVLGVMLGLLIASLTLTPLPAERIMTGGIDKVYHFLGFAALIFPVILTDSRRWLWAVPLAVAYGGAIELIQPSVGRSADWLDFGANLTGILAGAALAEILHDRIRDRFFAVETVDLPDADLEAEALRVEAMRAELVDELRVLLREELTGMRAKAAEASAPPEAEPTAIPPATPAPRRH
ncbi:VanZ family protein [Pararhodobacter aggregans]|uniref:VanZ family protein n=1 Tax=Pararhodobacter aggregans TaxID=404875 RepID=UPI003A95358C